uniref:Uncharacterized protein n=1 Tax=Anguilla anguilla TaxID=7936 RepID=A0A0E9TU86_ANGAN
MPTFRTLNKITRVRERGGGKAD